MKIRHLAHAACVASLALAATVLAREPSPANAEVYIVSPKDGAKVKSPVTVVFGLKGMGIAPAGIKSRRPPGGRYGRSASTRAISTSISRLWAAMAARSLAESARKASSVASSHSVCGGGIWRR